MKKPMKKDSKKSMMDYMKNRINPKPEKSIEEKINKVDTNPRINKIVERRYAKLDKRIQRAQGNTAKLKKIDKKYGYNYDAAKAGGASSDSTGHWPSIDSNTGMILKGPKHPSMIKTKKVEKILGNKIKKKDGKLYSVPKRKNKS